MRPFALPAALALAALSGCATPAQQKRDFDFAYNMGVAHGKFQCAMDRLGVDVTKGDIWVSPERIKAEPEIISGAVPVKSLPAIDYFQAVSEQAACETDAKFAADESVDPAIRKVMALSARRCMEVR